MWNAVEQTIRKSSSFLIAHPAICLLTILVILGAFWRQAKKIRIWRKLANKHQTDLWTTQGELSRAEERNRKLVAEQKAHEEQLAYWSSVGNCFEQQWTVVGVKQVRRKCGYAPEEVSDSQPYIYEDGKNVFESVPPKPPKLSATAAEYEPAIILAKNIRKGKFEVIVARPADMNEFPQKRLAKIDVKSIEKGWEFDIPDSKRGTGALSLALDYIVARARAEEIPALEGPLTRILTKGHHKRLKYFYADKYGFEYNPIDNRITKGLS
jgi:hypothetical protein